MRHGFTGLQFATQAIHAGEAPDPVTGAHNPPLYQTATYVFASLTEKQAVFSGEREGFIYAR
jgi:methionine-gamma-lyase